jgi:hypothetical protein
LSFYVDSAEEASVNDYDVEGVYSISFTHYPSALRRALEQNPSFQRCDVESGAGRAFDIKHGTEVICNADQLQAILSGLKNCRRKQNNIIVTETYRYWIFELLRQMRSFHVGLNEIFLFSVLQSDLSRVQIASEGQRLK